MPSSHILVEALHSIGTSELTELLVHVVGTRSGVVAKPDTKVLDLQGLLFLNLKSRRKKRRLVSSHSACHLNGCKGQQRDTHNIDAKDFTTGFLDFLELTEKRVEVTEPA